MDEKKTAGRGRKKIPFLVSAERLRTLIDKIPSRRIIAEAVGCDESTITKHYNGSNPVDLEMLYKYAQFFGVTTDYLLGLSETPSKDVTTREICDRFGMSDEAFEGLSSIYGGHLCCRLENGEGLTEDQTQEVNEIRALSRIAANAFLSGLNKREEYFKNESGANRFSAFCAQVIYNSIYSKHLKSGEKAGADRLLAAKLDNSNAQKTFDIMLFLKETLDDAVNTAQEQYAITETDRSFILKDTLYGASHEFSHVFPKITTETEYRPHKKDEGGI